MAEVLISSARNCLYIFRHAANQRNNLPDVAKEVVEYIWEIAKSVGIVSADKIHIVPGNHDLTRGDASRLESIVKNYGFSNQCH